MIGADLLHERYELIETLHERQATVYRGKDLRRDEPVVVKLYPGRASSRSQGWREAAILRRLRLPGVVRLLDEGLSDGCTFLVTPWVDGRPFPGPAGDDASAFVALVTLLAETLAQIHAAGVVHGDLKPNNVLVDADGHPKILDFGLARRRAGHVKMDDGLTGSIAYMSPSQLREQPATPACDCYALGVMCFEALAGEHPHPVDSLGELMRARLATPTPRLRPRLDGVPSDIVTSLQGLLAESPAERREYLDRLRRAASTPALAAIERLWTELPFLGELISRLQAGESVDLAVEHGPLAQWRGAVTRALEHRGRTVTQIIDAEAAFESLPPVLRAREDDDPTLQIVTDRTRKNLEAALADGHVLIASDGADRWTLDLLGTVRHLGGVVCLGTKSSRDTLPCQPPSAQALERLFEGPERLFDSRGRAARLLWKRTYARPDAMLAELAQWSRRGVGYWKDGHFVVEPEELAHLDEHLTARPKALPRLQEVLTEPLQQTLCWIQLGADESTLERVVRWRGERPWRVHAEIEELLRRSLIKRSANDRLKALYDGLAAAEYSPERVRQMHRQVAETLAPGHPQRFHHVLSADTVDAIVAEGCAAARHFDQAGHVEAAVGVLRLSHEATCRAGRLELLYELLAEWAKIVLASAEPTKLEEWLHHADHCPDGTDAIDRLRRLVELARLGCRVEDPDLLGELDRLGRFEDWKLELRRQMFRARLASSQSSERLVSVLDDIEEWVEEVDRPDVTGSFAGWMGALRFQQGDFAAAAKFHAIAATAKCRTTARMASSIAEAIAHMEALDSRRSLQLARRHLERARQLGHIQYQARLEHLVRANRYRLGQALDVDPEWVDAVERLALPRLSGTVLLTEAAIAWRNDDLQSAARLAARADHHWRKAHHRWPACLAGSLAWHCQPETDGRGRELLDELRDCPLERLSIQALALVGSRLPACPPWVIETVAAHRKAAPHAHLRRRLEVLSINEAWGLLGVPG